MIRPLANEENSMDFNWRRALPFSLLLSAIILAFYFYWFVIANRYVIFLYTHLGAGPFDGLTNGRYWMAGFVACGFVMILYAILNWYIARIAGVRYQSYQPSVWWHIWALCLIPNTLGIFMITMLVGQPTLPFYLAFSLWLTTALGLAFALQPGELIVAQPRELVWLSVAAVGLMPALLLLRSIELPSRGLGNDDYSMLIGVLAPIVGLIWLLFISCIHARLTVTNWTLRQLLIAGFCFCYLFLPVVHHLFFTPPSGRYITTAGNFFAMNSFVQLLSIFVAIMTALIAVQFSKRCAST